MSTERSDRPRSTDPGAAKASFTTYPKDTAEISPAQLAADRFQAEFPPVEAHEWRYGDDFTSDLEAALYWARCGFAVCPAGWASKSFLTRPEDIVLAWSGPHLRDQVLTRAPRGTLAVLARGGGPRVSGMDFYGPAPQLAWDERGAHWWQPVWDLPGAEQTFTLRIPWADASVYLWTVPDGFRLPERADAHHFPEALALTTASWSQAFPLPCRSSSVWASGIVQDAPAHVLRLADPTPLPCREQDRKGNPCSECRRYNNLRPAETLAAVNETYMKAA